MNHRANITKPSLLQLRVNYADDGVFPFSSVVLEEIDIISSWITDEVEKKFSLEVIGQDKSNSISRCYGWSYCSGWGYAICWCDCGCR